jgi:hypothetical protein
MNLNLTLGAKGGIGKTFLTFLYFLDCHKKVSQRKTPKYIFIDYSFLGRDLFYIFNALKTFLPQNTFAISPDNQFKCCELIPDQVLFIWNGKEDCYLNGVVNFLNSLNSILTNELVKDFINGDDLEIFVDTNYHIINFLSNNEETKTQIRESLEALKNINLQLHILFIWSFALLLEQRAAERGTIQKAITLFAQIWGEDNFDRENLLFKEQEMAIMADLQSRDLLKEIAYSSGNIHHIFNYYLPMDECSRNEILRMNGLKPLHTFFDKKKFNGKGVSFHYLNHIINNVDLYSERNDLNIKKIHILRTLEKELGTGGWRPANILLIPDFELKFTGFIEKIGELQNNSHNQYADLMLFDEYCSFFYREFNHIIKEIQLNEEYKIYL